MKVFSVEGDLRKRIKSKNNLSSLFLLISVICDVIPYVVIVYALSFFVDQSISKEKILLFSAIIALSVVFKALFEGLSIWKAHSGAYSVLTEIRRCLIDHMKKMPISFFQSRKTGDLTNIINHDVEQIEVYLAHGLPEIMAATIVPLLMFIFITLMDWRLGVTLVSTVPLIFLMRKVVNKLWGRSIQHFFESTKKMSQDLLEYVATIPVIKAFSREERKTEELLRGMREYIRWVKGALISFSLPMSLITMFLESGLVLMIIVGSILLSNGQIDLHTFVLSLIFGGLFSSSFSKLATFQHCNVIFNQSIKNILSVLGEEAPSRGHMIKSSVSGDIVFKDVNFSYNGKEKNLSKINLTFKHKTFNAIVGSSGSGKSTLASLIMGFWQPSDGSISIGGRNIAHIDEKNLSKLVSIVQQDVFLFNLPILENIRIGKEDAPMEEVVRAAKLAQVHDFIESLPDGYETTVGEAGVKFSGGEKQRISIARMILKNAPIVILDEATAAVDPKNEYLIQMAIKNLSKDKTVITIAHHVNTVRDADQIVVMDRGQVVAVGGHDDLLHSCPLYLKMVEEQNKVDTWQIKEALS